MAQYLLVFFIMLLAAAAFYYAYDRWLRKPQRGGSMVYVDALRDLLDGRSESAFTKLRQVVTEDSNNIDAYLRLAQILRDHNKPDRALQISKDLTLRSGLERSQKIAILRQLASDYLTLREYDTAQAALKELTSLAPQDRWAYAQLLDVQRHQKDWEKAYDTAAQILKLDSDKSKKTLAEFRFHMGTDLQRKGEGRKARGLFKEAIGLDPEYVEAYLAIGDSYLAEDRQEDAVNFWTKLIATVPHQGSRVIERLEKTLFELGRFGDIAGICESILEHSPNDRKARMTLAEFHKKKGELRQADRLLSTIIDEDPTNLAAAAELIRIYIEDNNLDKIEQLLQRMEKRQTETESAASGSVVDTTLLGIK